MVLGGLWHGASWNFVIWGAIHGAWLALERAAGKDSLYRGLPRPLRVALTFLVVLVAWVFFRAPDLPAATAYLADMVGPGRTTAGGAALLPGFVYSPYHLGSFAVASLVTWGGQETWDWSRHIGWAKGAIALGLLALALLAMAGQGYNPFIYFIF